MSDKKNTTRLTGLLPLAYTGVVANNPPQLVYGKAEPDMSNSIGFPIGSIWMLIDSRKIFMLTGLSGAPADWTQIYPETSETNTFPADSGTAESDAAGELNVFGGRSMQTTGLHQNLTIKTDNDLLVLGDLTLPLLGKGFVRANGVGLISSLIDGTDGEVLIGSSLGNPAWDALTSSDGSLDIILGANSIDIKVSTAGGGNLTSLDTDAGVATPVAGVITISGGLNINTSGATSIVTINLDNTLSIPGAVTAAPGIISTTGDITASGGAVIASGLVTAGNTLTVTAGPVEFNSFTAGVVQSSAAGVLSSSNGIDGQVLIGGGTNSVWANITSSDSTVGIVNGPNSIDLENLADKDRILGDTGYAIPDGTSTITVVGGTNIATPAGAATLTINLDNSITLSGVLTVSTLNGTLYSDGTGLFSASQGTDSQFFIGKTGLIPDWLDPVSENATITINPGTVPGTLNFQATGGGGGVGALDTLSSDSGGAIPSGGVVQIAGGDNINTVAAGNIVTINLDKSIYQPDAIATFLEGTYFLNGSRFLHNIGTDSTFIGSLTSKANVTPISCIGIGSSSLGTINPGSYNTSFGISSLKNITVGSDYNLGIGSLAGWNLNSGGDSNIIIRYSGGNAGSSTESYNAIEIGQQGFGGVSQENCYIAGIWNGGALDITHREPVLVDQYGKLSNDISSSDGDLLIGSAPYGGMQRGNITGTSGEITIINGAHSIDFADAGVACFSAYQASTVNNLTGDGTTYFLGSSSIMNEYFDEGGNFYIGDGSGNRAYFQAPYNGSYFFTIAITLDNINTSASYGDIISIYSYIDDVLNWSTQDFVNPVTEGLGQQSIFASGISYLLAGDKVNFAISVDISGVGKTIGIANNTTNVSGFLINAD